MGGAQGLFYVEVFVKMYHFALPFEFHFESSVFV